MNDPGSTPHFYPVSLSVDGRPCLVVGGGTVAARKVDGLTRSRANVTVVAPDVVPDIAAIAARIGGGEAGEEGGGPTGAPSVRILRRRYRNGDVSGYRLVVTATGVKEVDRIVARDAEAAGIWVNSADDIANSSFILPSVLRDGPVCISVSTSGTSPALATWLRDRIREALGSGLGDLATFIQDARNRVKATGDPTFTIAWHDLLDGPLRQLLQDGDQEAATSLVEHAITLASPDSSRLSDHDDRRRDERDDDHR